MVFIDLDGSVHTATDAMDGSVHTAAGGYWNMFVHETEKVYNDHTEKGVVFTLA